MCFINKILINTSTKNLWHAYSQWSYHKKVGSFRINLLKCPSLYSVRVPRDAPAVCRLPWTLISTASPLMSCSTSEWQFHFTPVCEWQGPISVQRTAAALHVQHEWNWKKIYHHKSKVFSFWSCLNSNDRAQPTEVGDLSRFANEARRPQGSFVEHGHNLHVWVQRRR